MHSYLISVGITLFLLTLISRLLPLFFRKGLDTPFVKKLSHYLPFSILLLFLIENSIHRYKADSKTLAPMIIAFVFAFFCQKILKKKLVSLLFSVVLYTLSKKYLLK